MKLDQPASEQIMAAVRTLLPEGVTIRRRGARLITKHKSARFEWNSSSSPAFGHISGRNSRAGALAIGYRETLRSITSFLTALNLRWPGLAWGPVEVNVKADGDLVRAELIDTEGHSISCP